MMAHQYTKAKYGQEQFRVGVVRDSMNRNEVIGRQRPGLGKVSDRSFDLPKSKTFTHGVKNYYIDGGVAEIMKQPLQLASPSLKTRPKRRDYMAINRASVQTGVVTAQEQKQFRMVHNIWQKDPTEYRHAKNLVLPPDFTHGMSNRPGTPIDTILRGQFRDKWVRDQVEQQNRSAVRALNQAELTVEHAFENKASRLRRTKIGKDLTMSRDKPWQMPKWETVPAQVGSFRSQGAHERAYTCHQQDMGARVGRIGQGVYANGKMKG